MTATQDDRALDPTRATRVPPVVKLLVGIGLAWGVYQLALFGVRLWVDHRIERSEGTQVIDFAVADLDGRTWRAADLLGRTVVLHFFRSHCEVCLAERPAIEALESRLDPQQVQLLGVLLDRVEGYPQETTERTLAALGYRHPILVADAAFVDAFHGAGWAHVTPVTYVIDATGRIAHSLRGRQSIDALTAALPAVASKPR